MRDLPYDYTTLVENIIDPSHVPVSHHGTVQGDRNLAQPIATSVSERMPPIGFQGKTEAPAAHPPLQARQLSCARPALGLPPPPQVPLHASSRLSFAQTKAVQTVTFTALQAAHATLHPRTESTPALGWLTGRRPRCSRTASPCRRAMRARSSTPSRRGRARHAPPSRGRALFTPAGREQVARGRSRILVRRARNFRTERVMRTADLVAAARGGARAGRFPLFTLASGAGVGRKAPREQHRF